MSSGVRGKMVAVKSDSVSAPPGYRVRPASLDDLPAIVRLGRAYDDEIWGDSDFTDGVARELLTMPELDLARDTWLIQDPAIGEVVGSAWLLARDRNRLMDADGTVDPAHRGRGIGSLLLDQLEARAADRAAEAAAGGAILLHLGVAAPDTAGGELLTHRGWAMARHFLRMDIDVAAAEVARRDLPPGIEVRDFDRERDARRVHAAIGEAFAEHWGFAERTFEDWERHRLDGEEFDPTLWWVAWDGEEVAGFLIGGVEEARGWVHSLGVRAAWRGRGIARSLLLASFAEMANRGLPVVSLDVDALNPTGATALYESVGMRVGRQYDVYERRLRDG